MTTRFAALIVALATTSAFAAEGETPKPAAAPAPVKTFAYDCEAWEEGVPPKDVFVVDGTIKIAAKDGNKSIMVDPSPIVDANAQLGESANGDESISLRVLASKRARSFPRFGVGVHGNSGYRLILNPTKKQLELTKNDETLKTAPFTWTTDTWTHLKLEAKQKEPGKFVISAKAWAADATEPAAPLITLDDDKMKGQGKASIWGTPFSDMPIYFDDIKIEIGGK